MRRSYTRFLILDYYCLLITSLAISYSVWSCSIKVIVGYLRLESSAVSLCISMGYTDEACLYITHMTYYLASPSQLLFDMLLLVLSALWLVGLLIDGSLFLITGSAAKRAVLKPIRDLLNIGLLVHGQGF